MSRYGFGETCGGAGYIECYCGGDLCACGLESWPCPGCDDCEVYPGEWPEDEGDSDEGEGE